MATNQLANTPFITFQINKLLDFVHLFCSNLPFFFLLWVRVGFRHFPRCAHTIEYDDGADDEPLVCMNYKTQIIRNLPAQTNCPCTDRRDRVVGELFVFLLVFLCYFDCESLGSKKSCSIINQPTNENWVVFFSSLFFCVCWLFTSVRLSCSNVAMLLVCSNARAHTHAWYDGYPSLKMRIRIKTNTRNDREKSRPHINTVQSRMNCECRLRLRQNEWWRYRQRRRWRRWRLLTTTTATTRRYEVLPIRAMASVTAALGSRARI